MSNNYQGPTQGGQAGYQWTPPAQGSGLGNIAGNALDGALTTSPWGAVAGGVGGLLSGMFGEKQKYAQSYDVNPGQRELWNRMYGQIQNQSGDFGLGSNIKAGNASLLAMMQGRGVDPRSGAALAAQSNMISRAMGADISARRNWEQGVLNSNLQQATRWA